MLLQESMHLVIVRKFYAAVLKMLNLIETCVLNFRRKIALDMMNLDFGHKYARFSYGTDILLQRC